MERMLLCVHAHPDDEATLTGGVLARYAAEGVRTHVVTCTGGEEGEVVDPDLDPQTTPDRLAELRRGELAQSLDILGADGPHLLGYRDSGMAGEPSNDDPRSFWRAPFDEAVGRLVAFIRRLRPTVVVTYDAFGGYGHPDHIQAHRVSVVAAEASAIGRLYPDAGAPWVVPAVYFATIPRSFLALANAELKRRGMEPPFGEQERPEDMQVGVPDEWIDVRVDVQPWVARKLDALRAHRSQVSESSFLLSVPEDLRDLAFGTEWFVRHRGPTSASDDLFAGLG